MPFFDSTGTLPAVVDLRLGASPTKFLLVNAFRYVDERDASQVIDVSPQTTDLASVPFFLQWLVRSYGRHTMAALVHDHLWKAGPNTWTTLSQANRLFRHAMWELGVPWIRRWFMWAAVELGMFARFTVGIVALVAWIVCLGASVTTVLAAHGYRMSRGAGRTIVIGGAAFVALMVVLALGSWLASLPLSTEAKQRWESMAKGALVTGAAAIGAVALIVLSGALGHWRQLTANSEGSVGVLAALGLVVWAKHVGAGIIASLAVILLAVPVIGVFAGLFVYAFLEILSLVVLGVARGVLRLIGGTPAGELHPLFKRPLQMG